MIRVQGKGEREIIGQRKSRTKESLKTKYLKTFPKLMKDIHTQIWEVF